MSALSSLDLVVREAAAISSICEQYGQLSPVSRRLVLDAMRTYETEAVVVPPVVAVASKVEAVPEAPKSATRRRRFVVKATADDVLRKLQDGPASRRNLARWVYGSSSVNHVSRVAAHLRVLKIRGLVRNIGAGGVWAIVEAAP